MQVKKSFGRCAIRKCKSKSPSNIQRSTNASQKVIRTSRDRQMQVKKSSRRSEITSRNSFCLSEIAKHTKTLPLSNFLLQTKDFKKCLKGRLLQPDIFQISPLLQQFSEICIAYDGFVSTILLRHSFKSAGFF